MADSERLTKTSCYESGGELKRYCPNCGADTQGEPIPQEYINNGFYGSDKMHYSKWVGISRNDFIQEWTCPNGCVFDRWTGFEVQRGVTP